MDETRLRAFLAESAGSRPAEGAERAAIARLRPEIDRAAARLAARRTARRQNLAFAACALAFAAGSAAACHLWARTGAAPACALWLIGAPMALILLIAPLMAYCLEKEREYEGA